jgi:cellulose synthase/poly-beta-1,6-N-acetylglucosamine synthase-like glycosyltransferase
MPLTLQIDHTVFLSCLAIHCVLATSVFWIAFQYMRHWRRAIAGEIRLLAQPLPPAEQLPRILIQIPTFNEGGLIARMARSLEALDWPRNRLHVQILDDSTDDSLAHARAAAISLSARGIDAILIARSHREGFKAGALAEGLRQSRDEYVAILDADYVPGPDFLKACMKPLLNDRGLGFVQARCDYINAEENRMTRAEQRLLDSHFAIEQPARNWSGQVMPFNGTCGVWRRAAIDAAGGWQGDTLAEDLDLSYRAQMEGWRALFLSTVVVKGEIPCSQAVWRQQQFRWTKGFAEAGRKLLWPVWRSRLTLGQKLVSTLHLGGGMLGPLFALTAATGLVDLTLGYGRTWPASVLLAFSLLGGALIGPALLILMGQTLVRGATLTSELPRLPGVLGLQISTGLGNLGGALEALTGRATAFERTPKSAQQEIAPARDRYAPETQP